MRIGEIQPAISALSDRLNSAYYWDYFDARQSLPSTVRIVARFLPALRRPAVQLSNYMWHIYENRQ